MIPTNQLNPLTEANATLQKAWQSVIASHKSGNPTAIQHATMHYLQVLQMVLKAVQSAIGGSP